ncbi:MAG TPA: RNA polymerase sigma factor [Verrucomicrobiae bacterium]|jgi:RNA polymerase sigma factor (sigma-70 family)
MADDFELALEFARNGSEEAFRELVERHSGMVHGVAMRVAGEGAADEVTQAVFVILARKVGTLREGTVVGAWLHRTARFVALEAVRAEQRRRQKNEAFSMMQNGTDPLWSEVAPILDSAISKLAEAERSAVVLRFLEGLSFADVARQLGISEGAAKMRVGRALEKLKEFLGREGVMTSASALALCLGSHSASAAPGIDALAATAMSKASSPAEILVKGGLKAMAAAKTKTAALAVAAVFLLCGGIFGVSEAVKPKPVVGTFAPMAGDWEGKIELSGDDVPKQPAQATAMQVRTSDDGRSCEIEMRVGIGDRNEQRFRFRHAIGEDGRTITTTDDPQIGLLNGPGAVTIARTNVDGLWRAAFKAKSRAGKSECEWTVNGGELKIVRHDILALGLAGFGRVNRYSVVEMHRKLD